MKGKSLPSCTTEVLSELKVVGPALTELPADELPVGNDAYTLELKEEGKLGLFLPRHRSTSHFIELHPLRLMTGIQATLSGALQRYHKLKGNLNQEASITEFEQVAAILATGCMVMAYLKCRAVVLTNAPHLYDFKRLRMPRITSDLIIPTPFAFCIQNFGYVDIVNLPFRLKVVPHFPSNGHTFGVPDGFRWNEVAYSQAVEYARRLGMQFSNVNTGVKGGSAWWLFKHEFSEGIFKLQCPLPESNYSKSMAVMHTLFLSGTQPDMTNTFADLTPLGTASYGYMLCNPHIGININSYGAFSNVAFEDWSSI